MVNADTATCFSENYCSLTVPDCEHKVLGVLKMLSIREAFIWCDV